MIAVLYVDDETGLLEIAKLFLEQSGEFTIDTITSAQAALALLDAKKYDIVISDYRMPGMDGIEFLKKVRASGNAIPFILFTGRGREEVVIEAINNGADFYIQKGGDPTSQFAELAHKIKKAVESRRTSTALQKNEERLRFALEGANDGIWDVNLATSEFYLSPRGCSIIGFTPEEISREVRQWTELVHPDDLPPTNAALVAYLEGKTEIFSAEQRLRTKSGTWKWVLSRGKVSGRDRDGNPSRMTGTHTDLTERKLAEDELRLLKISVDRSSDEIFWLDFTGRILYVNDSACRITGYSREELYAMKIFDLDMDFPPENWEKSMNDLRERKTQFVTTRHRCKNGAIIDVEILAVYVNQEDQEYIFAFVRDITARKLAKEELRAAYAQLSAQDEELRTQYDSLELSEAEWVSTFNAISDWIALITPDGQILRTNKVVESLLGLPPDQAIGKNCFELVHGTECSCEDCPRCRMLRSRKREIADIPMRDGNGWLQVTVDPILNAGGEVVSAVHIVRDISERTRSQKALEMAKKKMNLLNYVTFNDIQNQIFILSGYQHLVKKTVKEIAARKIMEKEENSLQKISQSLKFAQSYQDLGLKPPKWQNVNHTFLLAISHLDFLKIKHTALLDGLEIFADPLLELVFQILADNILTHGSTATEVTLRYTTGSESMTLFFEDNGAGIPEDAKMIIFTPDFQKKKGVGLFLAREILEITGISIRETGEAGKGARFEMIVPKGAWRYSGEE